MPVPFDSLRASVSGGVVTPEDAQYEETRELFNSMIAKRPAAIARCETSDDVSASIAFACAGCSGGLKRDGDHSTSRSTGYSI